MNEIQTKAKKRATLLLYLRTETYPQYTIWSTFLQRFLISFWLVFFFRSIVETFEVESEFQSTLCDAYVSHYLQYRTYVSVLVQQTTWNNLFCSESLPQAKIDFFKMVPRTLVAVFGLKREHKVLDSGRCLFPWQREIYIIIVE